MIALKEPLKFDWDIGNREKNWKKHNVTTTEAEELFFDPQKKIFQDFLHSEKENRYILLGATKKGRKLFIVFTQRRAKVRIISARDMKKKEQKLL